MTKETTKIFYLRDKHKFPVVCVASYLDGDNVKYAIATHNPLDKFERSIARTIALQRLQDDHRDHSFKHNGFVLMGDNIKLRIVQAIASDQMFAGRARTAAKQWLRRIQEQRNAAGLGESPATT